MNKHTHQDKGHTEHVDNGDVLIHISPEEGVIKINLVPGEECQHRLISEFLAACETTTFPEEWMIDLSHMKGMSPSLASVLADIVRTLRRRGCKVSTTSHDTHYDRTS
ncbi:hypothetical protein ACFL1X_04170 [Candidatus Hydrogenedentota bacterium]